MTPQPLTELAARVAPDQAAVLLRYEATLDKQPITADEFFNGPQLCIETRPAEYEDGCLIDPGDRIWFAGAGASSKPGSTEWDDCFIQFNETGLALRAHLQEKTNAE